jgi:hypothetical protein
MLDPKARWPKGRGKHGKYAFGLEVLEIAKIATTRDRLERPEITTVSESLPHILEFYVIALMLQVSRRLKSLSDKVEWS